jgi:acyl-CoA synthetase (AMP-forming)/AMP-acid ligase II
MTFYDDLQSFGQAIAFIAGNGETLTYAAAAKAADSFGAQLAAQGPDSRKLVFILAENCPECVIAYLGCLRGRCPVALLPSGIHADSLANLLRLYHPNFIWLPRSRASEMKAHSPVSALGDYILLANSTAAIEIHDDLALLMTTSGTTGSPKFVRLSYLNISANAGSISECLHIRDDDKPITTLPMHYVYGLSVINSHLHSGASVVLTNASLTEKRFWELFKSCCATTISGVPYTYELLKRLGWQRMNLPSLRVLTQAGGKLHAELVREFAETCLEKGMRFYVMYGAAEATARMSYLPPELAVEKPASIGMAIPGGELWIEDGELCYKGSNVSLGYAESHGDLARGDDRHGVLRTGDLATRDEDGAFYIVGRKSRFIKLFGNRINLDDVEQFIRNQGIDCACSGNDEALRLYISNAADESKALAFAQQLTSLHRSAFRTLVVSQLPRNEAGKVSYAELP